MGEATWVRSIYLYLMCAASVVLVAVGALTAVTGLVHTIAPDLGHRDTIDRVGIGVANIADEVVELVEESGGVEEYCRDVTSDDDDLEDCIESESGADEVSAISDGIEEVRSELRGQIRKSAVDVLIRGLLLIGAGVLLFRIHGHRTELFADGLLPKRRTTTRPEAPTGPTGDPAPVETTVSPPPPVPPVPPAG
jgi:hypothetical protein